MTRGGREGGREREREGEEHKEKRNQLLVSDVTIRAGASGSDVVRNLLPHFSAVRLIARIIPVSQPCANAMLICRATMLPVRPLKRMPRGVAMILDMCCSDLVRTRTQGSTPASRLR